MTLSDIEIGRIQGMKTGRRTTVEAISRTTKHSWETVSNALLAAGGERGVRKPRKLPSVEARRKKVAKMAEATKTKGGRTIPVYTSAPQMAKALSAAGTPVSASQVRRDLKAMDFVCRVRRAVPTRDPAVEAQRLKHAEYWCAPAQKKKIPLRVSSDEHTLSINDHTRRTMYVRRKRGVVLPRERRRMQNIPRIMVWAAWGVGFKSGLVVFPQKKHADERRDAMTYRLNAASYVRKCLSPIVPALVAGGRIFQHDGASAHGRGSPNSVAEKYLARMGVTVAPHPPYSPDLAFVEKGWPILNRLVAEQMPQTLQELTAAAHKAWAAIPQATLDKIAMGFKGAVEAVRRNNGACL